MPSIVKKLDELSKALSPNQLASEAYNYFRSITPIAPKNGGNARRNTDVERLGQAIHGDGESAVAEREQLRAHAELFVAKDERSRPRKIDLL